MKNLVILNSLAAPGSHLGATALAAPGGHLGGTRKPLGGPWEPLGATWEAPAWSLWGATQEPLRSHLLRAPGGAQEPPGGLGEVGYLYVEGPALPKAPVSLSRLYART